MPKRRKNGCWINKNLPTNTIKKKTNKPFYFDEDDKFFHRHGKVQVISVSQKIIEKHEHIGDGSKVLTGFVDIEKLVRVKDKCGETHVFLLEKILPFQILELEI